MSAKLSMKRANDSCSAKLSSLCSCDYCLRVKCVVRYDEEQIIETICGLLELDFNSIGFLTTEINTPYISDRGHAEFKFMPEGIKRLRRSDK